MRIATFLVALFAAFMTATGPGVAQTPPPVDAYAANTAISSVDISPNGQRLAMLAAVEGGERRAIVTNLDGSGATVMSLTDEVGVAPVGINWLSDEYLLLDYVERRRESGAGEERNMPRRYILRADGRRSHEIPPTAQVVRYTPEDPENVIMALPVVRDDRDSIMARRGAADGMSVALGLFRYNLERNSRNRLAVGESTTASILMDARNEPVVRYDIDRRTRRIEIFIEDGGWQSVYREDYEEERFGRANRNRRIFTPAGSPAGLVGDGPAYYTSGYDSDRNLTYAYTFNPVTGEQTPLNFDTQGADFGGYITDWRTGRVIGAAWDSLLPVRHYFEPEWRDLQAQLEATFPGSRVSIVSWDLSGNKIVVGRTVGGSSGAYYLFDRAAGTLSLIGRVRPGIPDEWVADVVAVDYRARDGLSIPAYVTLPPNRDLENLPLVVLPHGGPQARDSYGFDEWAQLIASRGYVVIQPQFRGSDGFGRDFVFRGHGEWGRAMQDDLTDSVAYLAGQGIIDPDRVCIFGWSYGGYAALAGATLTPDVYRCVISGAPVADVTAMMEWAEATNGSGTVDYWTEYIGDWRRQQAEMIAISPTDQVNNVQAPILLVHGTEDTIVPIEQSELMVEALEGAGKTFEYLPIEGGPHVSVLMTREQKQNFYTHLLAFLERYNPAD